MSFGSHLMAWHRHKGNKKHSIALTIGDPAGVGPQVVAKTLSNKKLGRLCRPLVVGDAWVLQQLHGIPLRIHPMAYPEEALQKPGVLDVLHVPHPGIKELVPGKPQKIAGEASAEYVRVAVDLALRGTVDALVTAPISKESWALAQVPFPGHTEMLAHLAGVKNTEMLMVAPTPHRVQSFLRTLLVTRHIPLSQVGKTLTTKRLVEATGVVLQFLKKWERMVRPRVVVCGLNPHAGDQGLLGKEEIKIVEPAVRTLKKLGHCVVGPISADAAFAALAQGRYDVAISLYHDQGLIPLKTLYPNRVVNVTLGLPFLRVSPGHGTAFNLAPTWKGADPTATSQALRFLLHLFNKKQST